MSRVDGLHVVTDPGLTAARGLLALVAAAVEGGASVVQLRDKTADGRSLFETLVAVAGVVAGRCTLLLDDRVDVALAARTAGAAVDGVHLGQSDLPVASARALLGPTAIVGLTANTPAHLQAVDALPAGTVDYLGVGVIRPTSTKPDHPAPLGFAGLAGLATRASLPCIAIGGITAADAPELVAAGAAGFAVVSAVCSADDPRAATRDLVDRWSSAVDASGVPATRSTGGRS
jgi:thiamine-phosphate diphosphorylase